MGTISFFGINKQHLLVWAVTLLMGGVSFSFAQCPPKDAEITFTSIQANAEETLVFGDEDILQPC
ncbi:MAG: hypothetical protein HYY40_14410, partial [Bacteroidetes bacterium]|nr:hypothetical protein [Bacteroidota bacterium]